MKLQRHQLVCRPSGFPETVGQASCLSPIPPQTSSHAVSEGLHSRRALGRWCDSEMEDRQDACPTSEQGFTMVEIAIALAIIGFALVAIIGILPAGLNVQKENREETIVNQEVSIWMDAIRSGSQGMDYLTNYVDAIEIEVTEYDAAGIPGVSTVYLHTQTQPLGVELINGETIVGLLTTPKYIPDPTTGGFFSNHIVAYVRAMSGGATEKAPQDNLTVLESAFSYRLTVEVVPFYANDDRWYDYLGFEAETGGGAAADDVSLAYARRVAANLHDVRLKFQWPLRPPLQNGIPARVGSGQLVFRTMVGGPVESPQTNNLFFVQPGVYAAGRRAGP